MTELSNIHKIKYFLQTFFGKTKIYITFAYRYLTMMQILFNLHLLFSK